VRTRTVVAAAGTAVVVGVAGLWLSLGRSDLSVRWHGPQPASAQSASARSSGGPRSPAGPRTLTVIGAGDVLLHPPLWDQATADARAEGRTGFDFDPVFAAVKPDISAADLAICHLETPLAAATGPYSGFPTFNVPPQVTTAIRDTGFDTCSTSSNHTLDQGEAGIRRTLDALDAAGLHHAGSYRDAQAQQTPNILDVHGVAVAQLSYSFGFNGLSRPTGREFVANLINPDVIIAEARRARAAGAQIVVVSTHWGTEYEHAPNADQQRWARQLLASPDIDLVLGCHAHVVQPFEKVNDKWVVYGMGNEVARHSDPIDANREGVMPRFTFTETAPGRWAVTTAAAVPTWVDLTPAIRIVDLPRALADPATPTAARAVYRAAYDRISGYLNGRGAAQAGLTIVPG
jgi:hypothetical protein